MAETRGSGTSEKRLRLRFAGRCVVCSTELATGTLAAYEPTSKTVRCLTCRGTDPEAVVDAGTAGASAQREYERRKALREARVKKRVGNLLGGVLVALTDEPQSTRAWDRGAWGEQKVAEALEGVPGVHVLHDRRVPNSRANIDHIVIGPAGVFVIDAKRLSGLIRVVDRGGLLDFDERLFVGKRDCSKLAENMLWQVRKVQKVLDNACTDYSHVPVVPALCFVNGEWPLLFPPKEFRGVKLEGTRSVKRLLTRRQAIDSQLVDEVTRLLASRFPAK
jgi:hypothetical protein